jgi:hypothetical protein
MKEKVAVDVDGGRSEVGGRVDGALSDGGIEGKEGLSEHTRRVEEFLAFEDPPTLLLQALAHRRETAGFDSLSAAEQTYLSLNLFNDMVLNLPVSEFFSTQSEEIKLAVLDGLKLLGTEYIVEHYQDCERKHAAGDWSDHDDEMLYEAQPFFHDCLDFGLDQYTVDEGLLPDW